MKQRRISMREKYLIHYSTLKKKLNIQNIDIKKKMGTKNMKNEDDPFKFLYILIIVNCFEKKGGQDPGQATKSPVIFNKLPVKKQIRQSRFTLYIYIILTCSKVCIGIASSHHFVLYIYEKKYRN